MQFPAQAAPLRITGLSSLVGQQVPVAEWAERAQIPNRKAPGTFLTGDDVTRIIGIRAKSWDAALFSDFEMIAGTARQALRSAQTDAADLDAVIVVTCTPYMLNLDQDAFRLMRVLGVPDHVPVLQAGAGCGGMARAVAIAARLTARRTLVVSYNIASVNVQDASGRLLDKYARNTAHPFGDGLWASAALFSDGAAAVVLERDDGARGLSFYSRDSQRFGDDEGFRDPLIHHLGGGSAAAAAGDTREDLNVFAMASPKVKHYYATGMMLNHEALQAARPDYVQDVRRIYTHQASPGLVDAFVERAGLPRDKVGTNVREFGNLVAPCTVKMLHDDLRASLVGSGDEICVSVVGAGPERGGFILPVAVRDVIEPNSSASPPPRRARRSSSWQMPALTDRDVASPAS